MSNEVSDKRQAAPSSARADFLGQRILAVPRTRPRCTLNFLALDRHHNREFTKIYFPKGRQFAMAATFLPPILPLEASALCMLPSLLHLSA